MNKLNLTVPEAYALIGIFMTTSPRTSNEKAILVPVGQITDQLSEYDNDLGIINGLLDKGLIVHSEAGGFVTTKLGASYVLRCKSYTPDFANLASNDISTANAMIFRGFDALKKHVNGNKIRPGSRGPGLVDALRDMAKWIEENTTYDAADAVETSVKSFAEIADKPVKRVRKTAPVKEESPSVEAEA